MLIKHLKTDWLKISLKLQYTKHEKSIAAQSEIVKHCFATAWQMLNDNHNNTVSQVLTIIRNKKYRNNEPWS